MSCRSRVAVAVVTSAIGVAAMVGTAGAAVVSGSNLSAEPNAGTCTGSQPCTLVISALPAATTAPGGARAGIDGVIVSWRIRNFGSEKPQSIALHLVRNNADAGIGPDVTLPAAAGIYEYAARMPVRAGETGDIEIGLAVGFRLEDQVLAVRQPVGRTFAHHAAAGEMLPVPPAEGPQAGHQNGDEEKPENPLVGNRPVALRVRGAPGRYLIRFAHRRICLSRSSSRMSTPCGLAPSKCSTK